eukprot:763456-Hanusia_phi.AAC.5
MARCVCILSRRVEQEEVAHEAAKGQRTRVELRPRACIRQLADGLLLPVLRDLHPAWAQPRPDEQHWMLYPLHTGSAKEGGKEWELTRDRRVCADYIAVR